MCPDENYIVFYFILLYGSVILLYGIYKYWALAGTYNWHIQLLTHIVGRCTMSSMFGVPYIQVLSGYDTW